MTGCEPAGTGQQSQPPPLRDPSFQRKEGEARVASIARFILSAWRCTTISHSSRAFIRSQRANPLKPVKTYFSFLSAAMSSS